MSAAYCHECGGNPDYDTNALREALIAMRELASVAHNGDPWYAENGSIDASAIFAQARAALGEEPKA